MTIYGFNCSVIAVCGGVARYGVFERILWRYDKIDHIETGLLYQVFHDGEVADVEWIE
jgi:hypothetical protein